jgi:hypothetical protein
MQAMRTHLNGPAAARPAAPAVAETGRRPTPADGAPALGGVLTPGLVRQLQAAAGNRATVQALRRRPVVQRVLDAAGADLIARRLNDAMAGLGTDEEAVYGALAGRTTDDITAIRDAYARLYDHSLQVDIDDEFSGDELAHVNELLQGTGSAAPGATAAEQAEGSWTRAVDIARHLVQAMEGAGTEEDEIWNALTGRTPAEIENIKMAYRTLTGRYLDRDFLDELSGDELRRALDLIGVVAADTYEESFTEEMMEGYTAGGTGEFEWALEQDQLRVEVPIRFVPDEGVTVPVSTWSGQIDGRWNQFAVTEPGGRKIPINIRMRDDPSGFHRVNVHAGFDRANTANWYLQQDENTAPHEFGHLMGLPDEYMRSPADFAAVTQADETITGPTNKSNKTEAQIARELHEAMYLDEVSARAPAATAVLSGVGLIVGGAAQQGQFAQDVKTAYDDEYASIFTKNLVEAMRDKLPEADRWTIQTVFAYTSRSIMGGTNGLGADQPHDHAVEPRHLRNFVAIVRRSMPSYQWTVGPK